MAKINTVLFDFDGTTMDTNHLIIQSWQHLFRSVEGKERPVEEIVQTFGEPLYITMEKVVPQISVEEGVRIYREYHYDNFQELIEVFPGILTLLAQLKEEGLQIGLVTSRLWETTAIGLKKYDMAKYFDVIITHDDTDKHKPDPEPVLLALEKLGAKAEEAIMVGDSMFDILCARNAGTKTVLVSWAMAVSEEEKNGPNGPDYILEKPGDLFEILADINQ